MVFYLSHLNPDEINFWQPGGSQTFAAIEPNASFLFKLHSPYNYIVGGGFFVRHSFLPLSLAWDSFGEKNGASDYQTFKTQILKYRSQKGKTEIDPVIGCIILASPFFFSEPEWIPVPSDWKPNIVQGKTYDTGDMTGRSIWQQVQERLSRQNMFTNQKTPQISEEKERYGEGYIIRPRLGQGAFRVLVTDAYQRRCAITKTVVSDQ